MVFFAPEKQFWGTFRGFLAGASSVSTGELLQLQLSYFRFILGL